MKKLSELTLEQKIGQMMMCGFHGVQASAEILHLIDRCGIGGVIYFSRNVERPQQLFQLSRQLQEEAKRSTDIPLLISVDQEGGMVARITEGIHLMPGNMALGATRDVKGVYEAAKISGRELRALGINMNLAPSVDGNNNPSNPVIGVRSFGDHPQLVGEMGSAAVRGYQEAGVIATVKHFPGHGDTDIDSHLDLPLIPHDLKRMHALELVPFKKAIQAGVDAVMSAHVVFPALDEQKRPSTLSDKIMTDLLRNELGFDGVIITDCLEMKAVSDRNGVEEAAVMAVKAGTDILLLSHTHEWQVRVIEGLIRAVRSGEISTDRIDESVRRILRIKEKRKLGRTDGDWDRAREIIRCEAHRKAAERLSERSITLVKDEAKRIPIDPDKKTLVIWPKIQVSSEIDERYREEKTLGDVLAANMKSVREYRMHTNPSDEEINTVLESSTAYEQIIIGTYNTAYHRQQATLIQALVRKGKDPIAIALRNPYDLLAFPDIPTYLVSYESRPLALQSTAKVLLGRISPQGKLPVALSKAFPYGLG